MLPDKPHLVDSLWIPSQKVDSSISNKCLPSYLIKWIVVSFHMEDHNRSNRLASACQLSNLVQ